MPAGPDNKNTKNPYHHGDLREALIDASVKLVCLHGSEAFTLKDASKMAGVSVAAPYRHFSDKAALLFGTAEKGFQMLTAMMLQSIDGMQLGTIHTIATLGCQYVRFAGEYPNLFQLMFRDHETSPEINLGTLFLKNIDKNCKNPILEILEIDNPDITANALMRDAPTEGIGCYSLLLKNVAIFLLESKLDVSETLNISTQMWATVHGTACLLIDRNFQKLIPDISTDTIIQQSTLYYLTGLLVQQKTA